MEFSKFYTVKTLQCLNDDYEYTYDISRSDTDKVNRLISFIQKERVNHKEPAAGDMIEYTTRSGDYYNQAHIERLEDSYQEICLAPQVPFCYENSGRASFDTSGGPWTYLNKATLQPAGIRTRLFKTWGRYGRCANGAVYFKAFVKVWKYAEPEPLFGKYTTQEWGKYFINKMADSEKPGEFTYIGDGFTVYSTAEFHRLVEILHGEVFDGIYHNSLILWGYRMDWEYLTPEEWNGIKASIHLSFLITSPLKIQTDHENHKLIIYKKK